MKLSRTLTIVTGAGALLLAGAAPAVADPVGGDQIHLTCGSTSYDVVSNKGNGAWTPVHDTRSTRVFIPTSFGSFTGTIRDANGTVVDTFTDPASSVKGSGARDAMADIISCTYTFTEVSDGSDPNFPAGYTFTGTGDVSGFTRAGH
jgi:hypothetical protein